MGDFFVLQMDDEFGDGVCFDNRQGGRRGSVSLALPPFCEGQAKATPDTMGCEARPQRRRGRGPRGGQGTPPDIGDTLRERGSSPHRPKGQRKYRSSPRSWDVRKGRDTPKDTPAQALLTARCSDSEPMRTWSHERLLGRPTAEDSLLGRRRHVQGSGGPHLLREPLLAQAIRGQGQQGRVPGSEAEPRIRPEAGRQSHQALGGGPKRAPLCHPPRSLRLDRCDYVELMSGLCVSRSTMCRAIARIGTTRKKGGDQPPSATSS